MKSIKVIILGCILVAFVGCGGDYPDEMPSSIPTATPVPCEGGQGMLTPTPESDIPSSPMSNKENTPPALPLL